MKLSTDKNILIATGNAGKKAEIKALLAGSGFRFIGLEELGNAPDVEETGDTYRENATLKARAYASHFGVPSLADDSGLEVAALGGIPGVRSARYGGISMPFAEKMQMLLDELAKVPHLPRDARFVCSMALADRDGSILVCEDGICTGSITREARGTNGFGYDPIFIPTGFDATFAELDDLVKNNISHRALAAAKIKRYLLGFTAL